MINGTIQFKTATDTATVNTRGIIDGGSSNNTNQQGTSEIPDGGNSTDATTTSESWILQDGDPVETVWNWSDPVDCFIKTLSHTNAAKYENGTFTKATYEVLVEDCNATPDRVLLTNAAGKQLGEFRVQDCQFLEFVNRIKLLL